MDLNKSTIFSIIFGVIAVIEAFIIALGVDVMTDLRDTAQYWKSESNLKDLYLNTCRDEIYEREYEKMEEFNQ